MSNLTEIRMRLTCLSYAIALAVAGFLAGCAADEDECTALETEDECMQEQGCAWGTDSAGPHCFYVGDVEIQ